MAGKAVFIKQFAWASIMPQLVVSVLIFMILKLITGTDRISGLIITSAIIYLILSFGLRALFTKAHRKGIKLARAGDFKEAIIYFEESYLYFSKRAWIDRFRYLALLSSSSISYREMALCNIAFCYGQIGDGEKSKLHYEKVLENFPESIIAKSALNMFKSAEKLRN